MENHLIDGGDCSFGHSDGRWLFLPRNHTDPEDPTCIPRDHNDRDHDDDHDVGRTRLRLHAASSFPVLELGRIHHSRPPYRMVATQSWPDLAEPIRLLYHNYHQHQYHQHQYQYHDLAQINAIVP